LKLGFRRSHEYSYVAHGAPPPATDSKLTVEQTQGASQLTRILSVFLAPGRTFSGLERNSSWWIAWLVVAVIAAASVLAMDQKIGFEQLTRRELAKNPKALEQFDRLPEAARERQLATSVTIARVMAYTAPVWSLVTALIIAGLLLGTFNLMMGADVRFRAALTIVMYSLLPGTIKSIVGILVLLLSADPTELSPQNPVASNLAYFIDPGGHRAIYALASSIDIFTLWTVVLIGIGFAYQMNAKRWTTISVVLGWYFLWTLLRVGAAALL
jgi:hypothetical protein